MKIVNVGNIIMNTYVYPCSKGYIMIDTGYENSLKKVENGPVEIITEEIMD